MIKFPFSEQIAHCIITNWAVSIGGEHFTGKITYKDYIEQLEYEITAKQAFILNKKDSVRADFFRWKKGDKSTRFWTIEELYKSAIKYVQEHFKDCKLLIRSCGASLDPSEIIWCANDNIKKELVRIYETHNTFFKKNDDPHKLWPNEIETLEDEWWIWIEKLYIR